MRTNRAKTCNRSFASHEVPEGISKNKQEVNIMADFIENQAVKSAVRKLPEPIADLATFNTIVQEVITSNPFGCVSYMTAGVNHQPVEKTREMYTAKFVYEDVDAKRVGAGSENYNTIAGFNAGVAAVQTNTANVTAHGGTISRNPAGDTYAVTLKCHDPNGELYYVSLSRDRATVSSYEDDAIRIRVEVWADGVTALA